MTISHLMLFFMKYLDLCHLGTRIHPYSNILKILSNIYTEICLAQTHLYITQ